MPIATTVISLSLVSGYRAPIRQQEYECIWDQILLKGFRCSIFFCFLSLHCLWLLLVERGEFEPHIPLSRIVELDAPLCHSYGLRRDLSGFPIPTLPKFARRRASKLSIPLGSNYADLPS